MRRCVGDEYRAYSHFENAKELITVGIAWYDLW